MKLIFALGIVLIVLVSCRTSIGQENDKANPPPAKADNVDKKENVDSTTFKAIITQLDRLSRAAAKEYAAGKSTADKQDSIAANREKILEFLESLEGKTLEFTVVVKDIAIDRPYGPFMESSLLVSTSQPKDIAPYAASSKPLRCPEFLSFHIEEEQRRLFEPRKPIFIKGEIVVSKRFAMLNSSVSAPIHLFRFHLQPAVFAQHNSTEIDQSAWAGVSIANVEFSNKPFEEVKPKN